MSTNVFESKTSGLRGISISEKQENFRFDLAREIFVGLIENDYSPRSAAKKSFEAADDFIDEYYAFQQNS